MNQIAKGLDAHLCPVEFLEGFLRYRKEPHQFEVMESVGYLLNLFFVVKDPYQN